MRLPILAGVLALTALLGSAQPAASTRAHLELRLEPEDLRVGFPETFAFLLVNTSQHDIWLPPVPIVDCDSTLYGAICLEVVTPPGGQGISRGCPGNVLHGHAILDRVQTWKVLHPGESYRLEAGNERALYSGDAPGTYTFWARYVPPEISLEDQQILRQRGIDFPHGPLTSRRHVFRKTP
jgi:hypothetical protein